MTFDRESFLDWLDDHDGAVFAEELTSEWPDFPVKDMKGCTGPIVDGKFAYYKHDLRRIANGRRIID